MIKILMKIETYINDATTSERDLIMYILKNPRKVTELDVRALAKNCYCSSSTIVRFCKKLGLKGFADLKLAIINYLSYNEYVSVNEVDSKKTVERDENLVSTQCIREAVDTVNRLDILLDEKTLNKVVDLVIEREYVYLFGIGQSYFTCEDFEIKLVRLGKKTFINADSHMQIISSKNVDEDSVSFIVSYSGETAEMIRVAKNLKDNGNIVVGIVKYGDTTIGNLCDYVIAVPPTEIEMRIGAGSSRLAQFLIVDIISKMYAKKTYLESEYISTDVDNTKIYSRTKNKKK